MNDYEVYRNILNRAYDLYKLDWCKQRGFDLKDWDAETGFNGESFAGLSEFACIEFQDEEYMAYLYGIADYSYKGNGIYTVDITESLSRGISVAASSHDAAIEIAEAGYRAGEYVLLPNDFVSPATFTVSGWKPIE